MPTQIAIDMDGVVADWNFSASLFGVDAAYRAEWLRCQDLRIAVPTEVDDQEVKRRIIDAGVAFWSSLPMTCERFPHVPHPADLYHRACKIVGEGNVYFLTAVGDDTAPAAAMGKVMWLRKILGNDFSEFFLCRARNKAKLSAPWRVLIDDHPRNIQQWCDADPLASGVLFSCPSLTGPDAVEAMWQKVSKSVID